MSQECNEKQTHDFFSSYLANTPSNNILCKAFIATFLQDEHLYAQEMASVEIGNSISFDQTFKVAVNIGFLREDKVWVSQ